MSNGADKLLGWLGSLLGVFGALLLASNTPASKWGYLLFLASSTILMCWSAKSGVKHLLFMQTIFTVINLIGVLRWIL